MTGHFTGSIGFGATTLTSSGGKDVFVAKLDPNGQFLWAKAAGGFGDDQGLGIAVAPEVDGSGNMAVYITGVFAGDLIEAHIEKIGTLRNRVIGWKQAYGVEPPPWEGF